MLATIIILAAAQLSGVLALVAPAPAGRRIALAILGAAAIPALYALQAAPKGIAIAAAVTYAIVSLAFIANALRVSPRPLRPTVRGAGLALVAICGTAGLIRLAATT